MCEILIEGFVQNDGGLVDVIVLYFMIDSFIKDMTVSEHGSFMISSKYSKAGVNIFSITNVYRAARHM